MELEDPGAHELGMPPSFVISLAVELNSNIEHSENESDVFSDAQEGQHSSSGNSSPTPTTRVEKVGQTKFIPTCAYA